MLDLIGEFGDCAGSVASHTQYEDVSLEWGIIASKVGEVLCLGRPS